MNDNTKNISLPYRPCVGIVLFNNDGKVFVGERIDTPGAWQMPQGGIDPNEAITDAAIRELKEETGTDNAELIRIHKTPIRYDLPDHLKNKLWNGRYAGQEQTWVAYRFIGQDSEIQLNAFDPPEFKAWQWVDLNDTLDLIVPFKRETYQKVIEAFQAL